MRFAHICNESVMPYWLRCRDSQENDIYMDRNQKSTQYPKQKKKGFKLVLSWAVILLSWHWKFVFFTERPLFALSDDSTSQPAYVVQRSAHTGVCGGWGLHQEVSGGHGGEGSLGKVWVDWKGGVLQCSDTLFRWWGVPNAACISSANETNNSEYLIGSVKGCHYVMGEDCTAGTISIQWFDDSSSPKTVIPTQSYWNCRPQSNLLMVWKYQKLKDTASDIF